MRHPGLEPGTAYTAVPTDAGSFVGICQPHHYWDTTHAMIFATSAGDT
jgi:hypothetical protein